MRDTLLSTLLGWIYSHMGIIRNALSLHTALKRCTGRGLQVRTIIDVGASDGRWSLAARKFFPHARCLLIEAQESHKKTLRSEERRVGKECRSRWLT